MYELSDLVPIPTRPSFKLSRGSARPYLTRPDHIISSFHVPSRMWDVDMFLQHKMICAEFPFFSNTPLPHFQDRFMRKRFDVKSYKDDSMINNAKIADFAVDTFQASLEDLCNTFSKPVSVSPLISDHPEYR